MLERKYLLTKTENVVLEYVKEGLTNKEISLKLGMKENTIKYHVKNILSKFGVHDRKKLISGLNHNG